MAFDIPRHGSDQGFGTCIGSDLRSRPTIKEVKDISTQVRNLTQLKDDLSVANLSNDLEAINSDSLKKDRNDFWVKYLKKDIYLGETLSIMNDVIQQKGMALKN